MIDENNQSSEDPEKSQLSSILTGSLLTALRYSGFAAAVFSISKFNLWLGMVLFAIFAFQVASRILFGGVILFIEGLVIRLFWRVIRTRGMAPSSFEKAARSATNLFWLNVIAGSLELYLSLITVFLGLSLFW